VGKDGRWWGRVVGGGRGCRVGGGGRGRGGMKAIEELERKGGRGR